jgi:hypothetical protein
VPKGVGHLFALVKTVEFDVVLGDDSFALRVELFQDKTRKRTFRANILRNESYRIQSTFPQNPTTGQPEHQPSDEVVLIDWSTNVRGNYSSFEAASSTAALSIVLKAIRAALDHSTDGKVEWRR